LAVYPGSAAWWGLVEDTCTQKGEYKGMGREKICGSARPFIRLICR
jgi:hypothetical protein